MTETTPRPRKSWGQNFLIDHNIKQKILDIPGMQPEERVVEIGPGRGILTQGLLERGAEVFAIEIDPLLVETLRKEFSSTHLHLIQGDALHYRYDEIPSSYKVIANLPYYISTPLLFRLLEERQRISRMVLMLQKEVAERLVAPVGGKIYGVLSVLVQLYADVRIAFSVSKSCFRPRPDVDSSVTVITPLSHPRVPIRDPAFFARVVRGAFAHRRKRLANALTDAGFPRAQAEAALQKMSLDRSRRGETLSLAEFALLADTLFD